MRITTLSLVALLLLVGPAADTARAGPPCVCWPIETGEAAALVVEDGTAPSVVATRLLAHLDEHLPVFARMESMRRATLALDRDVLQGERLVARLFARVLEAETSDRRGRALRWFDAGYAVACLRQLDMVDDLHGYRWIDRAISLGGDGAMHYGAALAVLMPHPDHGQFQRHLDAVRAAAAGDALVAKNLRNLELTYPAVLLHFGERRK